MRWDPTSLLTFLNSKMQQSQRPDGTLRKEVKVRPGYTAPDEASKYTVERAARFKAPSGIPGMAVRLDAPTAETKSKNQKRNEKKKIPKEAEAAGAITGSKSGEPCSPETVKQDNAKIIKGIQKKLRQIQELADKQATGITLDGDQLLKMSQKSSLEHDLSMLLQ